MEHVHRVDNFEHIKVLSDPRRLAILRLLMAKPATLSQLGQVLGEHPARIRHHLKQLEDAGMVELVDIRTVRGFVEKYYQAQAHAFIFQEIILPQYSDREMVAILGSHDMALDALAEHLRATKRNPIELLILPVGSMDGLVALRQGSAHIAGCHLLDAESGEYNIPFVRHIFPDNPVSLITLAHREQGLLVAPGNPLQIQGIEDLARPDVRMVNRNRGSGTRLWLDRQLSQAGIDIEMLRGYTREVNTHIQAAQAIIQGKADTGLGLQAAARQFSLDFIPLFEERFDLVVAGDQINRPMLRPIFDYLSSADFRQSIRSLGGYQTRHTGDQLIP